MERRRTAPGATVVAPGVTRFRVWAPKRRRVDVAVEGPAGALSYLPLERTEGGFFDAEHPVGAGTRYRYRLDGGECFPDPCSRYQPEGPHGPSEVVDPRAFTWTDAGWRGLSRKGQVLYELHVGTFSPEGTYDGVRARLPELRALGVTSVLLMPVHAFPGRFNWGYDGVNLYAPYAGYGPPDALRRLVDEAHRLGLGVLLDVVYNHLGPDGNYLRQYADAYFSTRYAGEWGEPLNLDGEDAGPVREWVVENACSWLTDFHFDGLRIDASQSIFDASERHVLAELAEEARSRVGSRQLLLIAENEPQDVKVLRPQAAGGHGLDGLWIDDFHHTARVAATGRAEAYLQDYRGTAQELLSCVLRNSLYQGQYYAWQQKPRGTPLYAQAPERMVFYLQNHDQVANSLDGRRLHALSGEARARALTTLWLLAPQTPLLFMGQELFAQSPFLYFVDHGGELREAVRRGRRAFISQFASVKVALEQEGVEVDIGERARDASRLQPPIGERPPAWWLHHALLRLRREDPLFARQDLQRLSGATLGEQALVLRYHGTPEEGDRLLVLNLGPEQRLGACAEPLLAPPPGKAWRPLLCSEETRFGGAGAPPLTFEPGWHLPGVCATVLTSSPAASSSSSSDARLGERV